MVSGAARYPYIPTFGLPSNPHNFDTLFAQQEQRRSDEVDEQSLPWLRDNKPEEEQELKGKEFEKELAPILQKFDGELSKFAGDLRSYLKNADEAGYATAFENPRSVYYTPENLTNLAKVERYFAYIRRKWAYSEFARDTPIVIDAGVLFAKFVQSREFHYLIHALSGEDGRGNLLNSVEFLNGMGCARFGGGIIAALVAIYTIAEQTLEIAYESKRGRWSEGVDAVLRWIGGWGSLCDAVSLSASGMSMAGWVGNLQWVPPLIFISGIISLVTLPLECKGIVDAKKIGKQMLDTEKKLAELKHKLDRFCVESEKAKEQGMTPDQIRDKIISEMTLAEKEEYAKGMRDAWAWLRIILTDPVNFDGDFWLRRQLGFINREQYAAQILYILDGMPGTELVDESEDDQAIINGAIPGKKVGKPAPSVVDPLKLIQIQTDLSYALKDRVKDRISSHYVAIISAIVGLIGVVILYYFATTNWGLSTGLGLVGASAAISATKAWLLNKRSVDRLEKWLDEVCPFDAIPDWYLDPTLGPSHLPWHNEKVDQSKGLDEVPMHKGPAWFADCVRHYDYRFNIEKRMREVTIDQRVQLKNLIDEYLRAERERRTEDVLKVLDELRNFICDKILKENIFKNVSPESGVEMIYQKILLKVPLVNPSDTYAKSLAADIDWKKKLYGIAKRFETQGCFLKKAEKKHYEKDQAKLLGTSSPKRYEVSTSNRLAFLHGDLAHKEQVEDVEGRNLLNPPPRRRCFGWC